MAFRYLALVIGLCWSVACTGPQSADEMESAQGTVSVYIGGIYRKTGESFGAWIDLPIEVVAE